MPKRVFVLALMFLLTISAASQESSDVIGPDTYPDDINPLTGLPVENPDNLNRRPLLIKISNYPPFVRDYQVGLSDAEIVWESLLAGGVTRFSALFLADDYEQIGPIRSARLPDFELLRVYNSLLTFSGMATGTLDIMRADPLLPDRMVGGSGPCPPLCRYPQDGLALEHTLFGNTSQLRDWAVERDADVEPEALYGMAFSEEPLISGTAMGTMTIRYRETVVDWQWDAESERWLRFTDGAAHMDTSQGVQVSATNVVVLEDDHVIQPFVRDQYWGPPNFAYSLNLIGSGRIFMLRDGQVLEGEWRRATRAEPLTFFDSDGNLLTFKPGNTFFNLVPRWIDGYQLEIKVADAPQAVVQGTTGTNMRYGPGEAYVTPDVAYGGDTFDLIGRNWSGTWVQLHRNDERAIWLPTNRVDVGNADVMSLPNARPTNERGG